MENVTAWLVARDDAGSEARALANGYFVSCRDRRLAGAPLSRETALARLLHDGGAPFILDAPPSPGVANYARALSQPCDAKPRFLRPVPVHVAVAPSAGYFHDQTRPIRGMSSNRDKPKDYQKALRAVAETNGSDTDDDGLDIVKTSRRNLDISQYIDGQ